MRPNYIVRTNRLDVRNLFKYPFIRKLFYQSLVIDKLQAFTSYPQKSDQTIGVVVL